MRVKAAEELRSMLISLRACVFWASASVTAGLGFLMRVPRADFWNMLFVLVRHMEATGDVMRFMDYSNCASETSLLR